jgi:hypothetical protein
LCAEAIGPWLEAENLFEVIVLAYEYNCEHLKKAVYDFLLANRSKRYFTNLTKTDVWINFVYENRVLAKEILTGVYEMMGVKF